MAVKNILKDGTVVEDMSKVNVPKEIVLNVYKISQMKSAKKKGEKNK